MGKEKVEGEFLRYALLLLLLGFLDEIRWKLWSYGRSHHVRQELLSEGLRTLVLPGFVCKAGWGSRERPQRCHSPRQAPPGCPQHDEDKEISHEPLLGHLTWQRQELSICSHGTANAYDRVREFGFVCQHLGLNLNLHGASCMWRTCTPPLLPLSLPSRTELRTHLSCL